MSCITEYNETLEKVRRISGKCPHFYVTGTSIPAMEKLGMSIVKTIEKEKLLLFKGLVKHFTIKMPYFQDMRSACEFLEHLKRSYSIARDCYDFYGGIILIEMSKDWAYKGYNSSLSMFFDYVQECEQACFVMIVPESSNEEDNKNFYAEFVRCGIWMKVRSKTPSVEQCVDAFQKEAEGYGFQIAESAKELLKEKLESRKEHEVENMTVVQQLIKQIVFNRKIEMDFNWLINENDFEFISGTGKKKQTGKIGFTVEH